MAANSAAISSSPIIKARKRPKLPNGKIISNDVSQSRIYPLTFTRETVEIRRSSIVPVQEPASKSYIKTNGGQTALTYAGHTTCLPEIG